MGNSPFETIIVCIDKEYEKYERDIRSHNNIKFEDYKEVGKAIDYIKKIRFQKTIIIISLELYPEFYDSIRKCEKELYIVPKIIIFDEKNDESFKCNTTLPINNPFYNIGGKINNKDDLINFVTSSINIYKPEFEKNKDTRVVNEKLTYQLISDKEELILPIFYTDHISPSSDEEIKTCIGNMFQNYESVEPLGFIFSQINKVGNIPLSILSKFLVKAYSTHKEFSSEMNKALSNGYYADYLPIIKTLYKSAYYCYLKSEYSKKLYKCFIDEKTNWEKLFTEFNTRRQKFPEAILYGTSFFSFYNDDDMNKNIRNDFEKNKKDNEILIELILEETQNYRNVANNAIIVEELSYYEDEKEILFFPFSCFEIKKIENNENKYTITLNYLSGEIFINQNHNLSNASENDYQKSICNSGLIDKIPSNDNNSSGSSSITTTNNINTNTTTKKYNNSINNGYANNNLNNNYANNNINSSINSIKSISSSYYVKSYLSVRQPISNTFLMTLVFQECNSAINENMSIINDFENLKKKIQEKLNALNKGNWYVSVREQIMNKFGTIDENSMMIFASNNLSKTFFIHVANI